MKLKRKRTCFNQDDLYEKRMYLQCFHYRTTDYLQKKFQDESSVLKAKQLLETLHMAEERDFLHVDAEVHRVIKMPPPSPLPPQKKKTSTTVSKIFTLALAPLLFISVGFLCEIFMLPDLYILLPPQEEYVHSFS